MATVLTFVCLKTGNEKAVGVAIPLGLCLDFLFMYNIMVNK